jgi:hypothetical protein
MVAIMGSVKLSQVDLPCDMCAVTKGLIEAMFAASQMEEFENLDWYNPQVSCFM